MKNRIFTQQSLCGRNALDLPIYIFFAPLIILIQPLNELGVNSRKNFSMLTFSSILSFFMLLGILKILQLIFLKKEQFSPLPIWLIFVIGALVGVFKSSTLFWINMQIGTTISSDIIIGRRILLASFAWGCIVPIFAVTSNHIAMVRSRRIIMMDELLLEESVKLGNEVALIQIKKSVRLAIESDVSSLMQEVQTQISQSKDSSLEERYQDISRVLLDSAENFIRPMSHKLMEQNRLQFPSPTILQIFLLAVRRPIFPLLPLLALNNISSLTVLLRLNLSALQTLALCLAQSGILAILIVGFQKFITVVKSRALSGTVVMLAINVYLGNLCVSLIHVQTLAFATIDRFFLSFFWELSFFILVSFTANLFRNESEIEAFVNQLIDSSKIDQALAQDEALRVQYDIARYLHGNLQSRLMSLGLTLKMSKQHDEASMASAMSIADSLLNSPFAEYLDVDDRTLSEEVDFAVSKWEGLLIVRTNIADFDTQLSFVQKRAIGAALEEALANALRHGFAKEVDINIYQGGHAIAIDVIDDGIGPRMHKPGLGSRLYDSIAVKGWTLQYRLDGLGTILELRI